MNGMAGSKRQSDSETDDDLRLPFIVVPPGAPPPAEWLALHPGAIRITNGFASHTNFRANAVSLDAGASFGQPHGRALAPGGLAAYGEAVQTATDSVATASPAPQGNSDQPQAAPWHTSPNELRPDLIKPVPLVDDAGNAVLDFHGQPILRPEGFDPHYFIEQGLRDRKEFEMPDILGDGGSAAAASARVIDHLAKFRQSGAWDAQRVGGIFHKEFRDYATVAIGLYASAAGLSEDRILSLQNFYARQFSRFNKISTFNSKYQSLPQENIYNTDVGYSLFHNKKLQNDTN